MFLFRGTLHNNAEIQKDLTTVMLSYNAFVEQNTVLSPSKVDERKKKVFTSGVKQKICGGECALTLSYRYRPTPKHTLETSLKLDGDVCVCVSVSLDMCENKSLQYLNRSNIQCVSSKCRMNTYTFSVLCICMHMLEMFFSTQVKTFCL